MAKIWTHTLMQNSSKNFCIHTFIPIPSRQIFATLMNNNSSSTFFFCSTANIRIGTDINLTAPVRVVKALNSIFKRYYWMVMLPTYTYVRVVVALTFAKQMGRTFRNWLRFGPQLLPHITIDFHTLALINVWCVVRWSPILVPAQNTPQKHGDLYWELW